MSLLDAKPIYKPFNYPWAYDAWLMQQQIHWLPEEVPLSEDVRDWKNKLSPAEKNLLTQLFRFFTQSDLEVSNCYHQHYLKVFQPTEVRMMLLAFANMETIHLASYSYLLDTVGMPEIEYQAFLQHKEMKDKYDYMHGFNVDDPFNIAVTLAAFGAFTEGLQLFSSFAIMLNFPRYNKMKGMGQIITLSVRDESLHCESIIKLFHTFVQENPSIDKVMLHKRLLQICEEIVMLEDNFIDLAFEQGGVEGLEPSEVKSYIRYIANRRLTQLGMYEVYDDKKNPLPWLDMMLNGAEHTNFFENRVTEYTKAGTTGDWDEVF